MKSRRKKCDIFGPVCYIGIIFASSVGPSVRLVDGVRHVYTMYNTRDTSNKTTLHTAPNLKYLKNIQNTIYNC